MQRVNEIRRKRDDPPDVATKVRKVAQLLINNDILFLLSLTNPNIKRILPKPSAHLRQTDFRSTSLKVEHSYSFDISLKFHINLRSLCIKNASVVHFRAMEGKELDVLVLDSISRFDFSEEPKISVSKLVLRNIKISLGDFSCMLNMLAPKSLQLVNTHLRERSNDAVYQALSRIVLLDLWDVETVDSFIDIDKFLYLVREKRLNKFSFASGDKILSYSCVARSLSHLVLKGVDGRTIKSISNWDWGGRRIDHQVPAEPCGHLYRYYKRYPVPAIGRSFYLSAATEKTWKGGICSFEAM